MFRLQGNWCVTEGPTYIWVDGAVRERALLIASTDLHNCAVAADPALISTLDRSIAVALETKNTPGKGMIIAFVSVALSAAQLVKQQAMAAISFDSLVGSLQREETRIEVCSSISIVVTSAIHQLIAQIASDPCVSPPPVGSVVSHFWHVGFVHVQ